MLVWEFVGIVQVSNVCVKNTYLVVSVQDSNVCVGQ